MFRTCETRQQERSWQLFISQKFTDQHSDAAYARQNQAGDFKHSTTVHSKSQHFSSRFTSSKKYEGSFVSCFKLQEVRHGEVCNACVLIVKRWKKLPKDSHKNWAHVVDARNGPGIKNVVKQKPKDQQPEAVGKIKKKHVYKKNGMTKPSKISDGLKGMNV